MIMSFNTLFGIKIQTIKFHYIKTNASFILNLFYLIKYNLKTQKCQFSLTLECFSLVKIHFNSNLRFQYFMYFTFVPKFDKQCNMGKGY